MGQLKRKKKSYQVNDAQARYTTEVVVDANAMVHDVGTRPITKIKVTGLDAKSLSKTDVTNAKVLRQSLK